MATAPEELNVGARLDTNEVPATFHIDLFLFNLNVQQSSLRCPAALGSETGR